MTVEFELAHELRSLIPNLWILDLQPWGLRKSKIYRADTWPKACELWGMSEGPHTLWYLCMFVKSDNSFMQTFQGVPDPKENWEVP